MKTNAGYTIIKECEQAVIGYNERINEYVCWRVISGDYCNGEYTSNYREVLDIYEERKTYGRL